MYTRKSNSAKERRGLNGLEGIRECAERLVWSPKSMKYHWDEFWSVWRAHRVPEIPLRKIDLLWSKIFRVSVRDLLLLS